MNVVGIGGIATVKGSGLDSLRERGEELAETMKGGKGNARRVKILLVSCCLLFGLKVVLGLPKRHEEAEGAEEKKEGEKR